MALISASDVALRYPIYSGRSQSVRSLMLNRITGRIHADVNDVNFVHVFQGLSFEFNRGDRIAVLGRNGAGKSSFLRMLAGIYAPWSGRLDVNGSVGALFELGGGMDIDLTGRENIRRAGVLQAIPSREMESRIADAEKLVDIGRFFDLPVRSYSSGMTMRVAFAMSTLRHPEILLVDEVYGAGDFEFQARAQKRIDSIMDGADVLVFASHALDLVKRLCNRGILLKDGALVADGPVETIVEKYLAS
jgi:lipopolysaccharide transport system ATP-binding protein